MLVFTLVLALFGICTCAPTDWIEEKPEEERHMGMAWDAAATVVNKGVTSGRFMVPKKVMEARKRTINDSTDYEILAMFQEGWCGPWEKNTVEEICESMCPLYHGGKEALYKINSEAGQLRATKMEEVIPLEGSAE
ncbi:hypothetical protein GCK32_010941 [Trichostrongylus colubriformis]|uniref:Uncharacterized protein n=1 Tax=Trichostrongylus colubriformis TaxID=6319 RepID=A0AAN8FDX1_TRICO